MNITNLGNLRDTSNALRIIYGASARKKIARAHSVSDATAKKWLADGLPESRLYRMAAQLRDDIARHQAEVEQVRRWVEEIRECGGPVSVRHGQSTGLRSASSGSVQGSWGLEASD